MEKVTKRQKKYPGLQIGAFPEQDLGWQSVLERLKSSGKAKKVLVQAFIIVYNVWD